MMTTQEQPIIVVRPTGEAQHDDHPLQPKLPFTPPKLTFVAPKLVKRGGADDILQGSFLSSEFSP